MKKRHHPLNGLWSYQEQVSNSLLFILFLSCSLTANSLLTAQTFTDVVQDAGIEHTFSPYISIGGGAAFFDYDMDGDEDVYFTGGRFMDKLYRNENDGTFTDVTIESGLGITETYYTTGVTTGDIDNDGFREIFVTTFGFSSQYSPNRRNLFFRNMGDGTFQEVAPLSNLGDASRSVGAIFFDHDLDGYLDLYVLNYVDRTNPITDQSGTIGFDHDCYENYFYHNNGNFTFTEAAFELGVNDDGCSLAGTNTDFDTDSDQDLYVVNDFGQFVEPNLLYTNELTTGVFDTIVGSSNGSNIGLYGMGVAWGDYDLDQDIDYYITNLGSNALLNNDGTGQYQDVAAVAGVTNTNTPDGLLSTSWGTAFIDFDNNLYEDLFVSNGYIPAADFIATGSLDPNKLYYNNGDQTFTDISDAAGFNSDEKCRGLAYGDYDNDGDIDLLVSSMYGVVDAPAVKLYRNDLDNSNNWVKIKLEGTQCNRDAIGAQISVFVDDLVLIREISGGGSHASQHSSIAHFGLADYSNIDSVQVNWPGNPPETFFDLAINEQHLLIQGASPTVRINFSVDMSFQEVNPDGVYVRITSEDGDIRQKLLYSPYQDDQYSVSFLQELGFSGSYTLLNGRCNDGNCQEDLSEENCDDLTVDFERLLAPVLNDTTINLCFGVCYGLPCQSTVDSFSVHFAVNAAPLGQDLDDIFIRGLSPTGGDLAMSDPEGDGIYELSINLAEGFSTYFTYVNGDCNDESCTEDLSGQDCTDQINNYYRYLPPLTQDTNLTACYGVCDTDNCIAPPNFNVHFTLNAAPLDEDLDQIFIRGLSPTGADLPMNDPEGDGIYELSITLDEGYSTYYTYVNGECSDESCTEDLSGQGCTDEENSYYRYLPPLTQDAMLNACYGVCNTDSCFAPIDTFRLRINLNMTNEDLNPTGVFIIGDYFGLPGMTPLYDGDGDGIYSNFFDLPETFTTYYSFTNGSNCPGTTCYEDLSGQPCANTDQNNFRYFGSLTSDTTLNLCFGECQLAACFPPADSVDITFNVNMAPVATSPEGVYWLNNFGAPGEFPLTDMNQDDIYTFTIRRPEGFSTYYSIANGTCPDLSCLEDLEGQACADPFELNYRLLDPVYSDTILNLCFGSCDTINCIPPIDSVDIQINVNMAAVDVATEGVYLVEGAFGAPGINPMDDTDGDGVYSINLTIPEGFSSFYSFTNGLCPDLSCKEDLTGQDCGPPNANNNRWLPPVMQDTIINTCFAECIPDLDCTLPPNPVEVIFTVDMLTSETDPAGVYLIGDFGLTNNEFLMTNNGGDSHWATTLSINPGNYYYRFVNGSPDQGIIETLEEDVLNDCSEIVDDIRQRPLLVIEEQPIILDTVCFNECIECIIDEVDQALTDLLIFELQPNPAKDYSHLICRNAPWARKQIRLINAVGQVVEQFELAAEDDELLISTNDLPAGIYWVSLEIEGGRLIKKLIIQ